MRRRQGVRNEYAAIFRVFFFRDFVTTGTFERYIYIYPDPRPFPALVHFYVHRVSLIWLDLAALYQKIMWCLTIVELYVLLPGIPESELRTKQNTPWNQGCPLPLSLPISHCVRVVPRKNSHIIGMK